MVVPGGQRQQRPGSSEGSIVIEAVLSYQARDVHGNPGEDLERNALLLGVGFEIGEHSSKEEHQVDVVPAAHRGRQGRGCRPVPVHPQGR